MWPTRVNAETQGVFTVRYLELPPPSFEICIVLGLPFNQSFSRHFTVLINPIQFGMAH